MRYVISRLIFLTLSILVLSGCAGPPYCRLGPFCQKTLYMDYYVSVNGSDSSGSGSRDAPWRHIQYSLDRINEAGITGAILNVLPGDYEEKIKISKPVRIIGAGVDKVRLFYSQNQVQSDIPIIDIEDVFGNKAQVEIKNLTIDGSNVYNRGMIVKNSNIFLSYVKVINPYFSGIDIEQSIFDISDTTVTTVGLIWTDTALWVSNSTGTITRFWGGDHIDHILWISGPPSSCFVGAAQFPLCGPGSDVTISDSKLVGSPIYYADGIRLLSPGNVTIENTVIRRPLVNVQPPSAGVPHGPPYAGIDISGTDPNLQRTITIKNCSISGFDVGIGINLVGNKVLVSNTNIENSVDYAVDVWPEGKPYPVVDFGSAQNIGRNTFHASSPFAFWLRVPFNIMALHNNWDVAVRNGDYSKIDSRIHDKNDDPNLGLVQYK